MVPIKLELAGDVRRFNPQSSDVFNELTEFARQSFGLSVPFHLKYIDDEDDHITITGQQDLEEAVRLAKQEQRKSLKISVHPAAAPKQKESVSGQANVEADAKTQQQQQQQQPSQEPEAPEGLHALLLSFVQDPEIQEVLPDAVQVVISILQQQQAERNGQTNLMEAIEQVFSTFPVIRNHAFIEEVYPRLPQFCERAQHVVPFALNVGGEMVSTLLPQVLQMVSQMAQNGGQWDWMAGQQAGMHPMMSMFAPMFAQFMAGGGFPCPQPPQPEEEAEAAGESKEDPRAEVVHHNVACDACEKAPIVGIRFKCAECPNFDLCQECEARPDIATAFVGTDHTIKHVLIKYRKPVQYGPGAGGPPCPPSGPWGSMRGGGWGGPFAHGGRCGPPPYGPWRGRGHRGGWGGWGGRRGGRRGHCGGGSPYHGGQKQWWRKQTTEWTCELCTTNNRADADFCASCTAARPAPQRGRADREINAEVLKNVTLPEGTQLNGGVKVVKTWEVKNTGTIAWPEGTTIVHCRGDRFGPFEARVPPARPGETVNVSVDVNVPTEPGHYAANYRLKMPSQHPGVRGPRKFGGVLNARFVVLDDEQKAAPVEEDSPVTTEASAPVEEDQEMEPAAEEEPEKYAVQLTALAQIGFPNKELNTDVLEKNDGNLPQTVQDLLKMQGQE